MGQLYIWEICNLWTLLSLLPLLAAILLIAVEHNKGVLYYTSALSRLNFGIAIVLDR
jgi:hypothetical protein